MKVYTEKDLEGFERDDLGWLICPSGDYTHIKSFGEGCSFGEDCSFGEWCCFGERCGFGKRCSFGKLCNFGERCRFGEWCSCGERCSFLEGCGFGEWCSFGKWCSHEGLTDSIYTAFDRIGSASRKAYFFKAQEGYYVRTGCFFGSLEDFQSNVGETHGGTIHEQTYFMAGELAKKILAHEWDKHHAETDLPA